MRPNVPLAPGSQFAGRFRVVHVVGTGKTGTTYAVDPPAPGERCALKVMSTSLVATAELRAAFAADSMGASVVKSAHVVEVVDAGIDEATGQPWLATELLSGEDLGTRVHRWGRVPLVEARRIVAALGDALGAALAAGLMHHDLSPRNVHLLQDADHTVKLRELGISKLLAQAFAAEQEDAEPESAGSASWIAPEQLQPGKAPTPAANVWSLGLIAFYALTGRPYWEHAGDEAVPPKALLREVLSEPLARASERAKALGREGSVPSWFDGWFARCVARKPRDRFKDARVAASEWAAEQNVPDDDEQRPTIPLFAKNAGKDAAGDDERLTLPLASKLAPAGASAPSPTPPPTAAASSHGAARRRSSARVVGYTVVAGLVVAGGVALVLGGRPAGTPLVPADPAAGPGPAPSSSVAEAPSTPASAASGAPDLTVTSADVAADASGALAAYDLDTTLKALNRVYYGDCRVTAPGKLLIQFAPSGHVKQVKVEEGGYDDATAGCLAARFRGATVPPWTGAAHYVTATVQPTK